MTKGRSENAEEYWKKIAFVGCGSRSSCLVWRWVSWWYSCTAGTRRMYKKLGDAERGRGSDFGCKGQPIVAGEALRQRSSFARRHSLVEQKRVSLAGEKVERCQLGKRGPLDFRRMPIHLHRVLAVGTLRTWNLDKRPHLEMTPDVYV